MTPTTRSIVATGAAVLFSFSLTACGGAPTDASEKDFCERVNAKGGEEFSKAFADRDFDKIAELIKEFAEKAEEVGTPEGIPDDAREGWELQINEAKNLDGDELEKASKDPDGEPEDPFTANLSKGDKEKVEAYTDYEEKTC